MGLLKHCSSSRTVVLAHHCVAGRALDSGVRLGDHAASYHHASLGWTGQHWEVRDLGSTNGTRVDGAVLEPGETAALSTGALLRFGCDAELWTLDDDTGPVAVAQNMHSCEYRVAECGLLALPDQDNVVVVIVMNSEGCWFMESVDGARRPLEERELITLSGEVWAVTAPPKFANAIGTYKARESLALMSLALRFFVSRDEEHIRVDVLDGKRALPLGERACFYLLLLLARERRKDAEAAVLPESEQGWYDVPALCSAMATGETNVNVAVHRIREAFAKAGVAGAEGIVERRRRQIRIGTGRLNVPIR